MAWSILAREGALAVGIASRFFAVGALRPGVAAGTDRAVIEDEVARFHAARAHA